MQYRDTHGVAVGTTTLTVPPALHRLDVGSSDPRWRDHTAMVELLNAAGATVFTFRAVADEVIERQIGLGAKMILDTPRHVINGGTYTLRPSEDDLRYDFHLLFGAF